MNAPEIILTSITPLELESIGKSAAKLDEVDKELLPFFEEEAHAELQQIEKLLHAWAGETGSNPLKELRLHFHTIKGAANSIGHLRIGVLAGGMEDTFKQLASADAPALRDQLIKTSIIVLQAIHALMKEARQPQFSPVRKNQVVDAAELIMKLKQRAAEPKGKT